MTASIHDDKYTYIFFNRTYMKNNKNIFFCEQPKVYITIFTKYDKMIIHQLSQLLD